MMTGDGKASDMKETDTRHTRAQWSHAILDGRSFELAR